MQTRTLVRTLLVALITVTAAAGLAAIAQSNFENDALSKILM